MKEILKKVRKYEVRIRKAITSQMQGDFHSIFKGSGLEFDDVRTYQYGDDVRTIDWNVSAKGHGTFVKTFKEEKEQSVFFLLDVSASQEIGNEGHQKIDVSKEVTAVLALAAIKENSQVGLICFSDQQELYIKPGKGQKHSYQVMSSIFSLKTRSKRTDLNGALKNALNLIKKKSIIILVSDFMDEGYEQKLKAMARTHDLIVLHITDKSESSLPNLGIIPMYEKETGKTVWVNSSSFGAFRTKVTERMKSNRSDLQKLSIRNQINYLEIDTKEDYIPKLIKLFTVRNRTLKSIR
ncbi:MAG: DUF58 domain-containing protein [Cyclobacteriaceae bacterium]